MIVKVKFSKYPIWDDDYMSSQREYSFTIKCNELKKDYVVWNKKYHKFLHVTETILDVDSEYYTPSIDKYTKTKYNNTSFKLTEIKETGDWYFYTNPNKLTELGYINTSYPIFE